MNLVNKSSRPTDEVRSLVEFAFDGHEHDDVAVIVMDWKRQFRGFAWREVPAAKKVAERWLIEVWISSNDTTFPASNLHGKRNTLKRGLTESEARAIADRRGGTLTWTLYRDRYGREQVRFAVYKRTPYGGIKSPIITYRTWRHALVGVAAHELCHIEQFRRNATPLEHECEQFAFAVLRRYDDETSGTAVAATRSA